MKDVLCTYDVICLGEMQKVRLMNRIDTKYITTVPKLIRILQQARTSYFVQDIDGQYIMPYHTLYYDTPEMDMYMEHLRGRKRRQKIRIRSYEASDLSFLEVKNKSNKGRTKKSRIPYHLGDNKSFEDFIGSHGNYPANRLSRQIENRFSRITLVNRNLTERLTIDVHLRFRNLSTGETCSLEDLAVIELKRDGYTHSPILHILKESHIHPSKFSKYCMGMALTDEKLRSNRFKPRLRSIEKLCNLSRDINF